jgi:quinohemoprotein ethanol dehydrogenase
MRALFSRLSRLFKAGPGPIMAVVFVTVLFIAAACQQTSPYAATAGAGADWPNHGGGADETGFSQLTQINTRNVDRLGLVASLDLEGEVTLEATPIEVNGVLYFTGSRAAVYAVNAVTGELLWKYDPEIWRHHPEKLLFSFAVNRGAAYANGRVFAAALDGRLFALDARTGELLWSVETLPQGTPHTSTGAPRVFNNLVIIGNGGAEIGVRGYVTAYDQATGQQVWRFYTVPGSPEENAGNPAMERAAATWSGEWWRLGGGGTVWNGITFDEELNRIYLGVGNGGPWDPELRSPGGGDNLYLSSIVALDAATGEYVWHYQENPREAWDYKATPNIIMATIPIDGAERKVLIQASTNGFFYVLDRETGRLLSAEKFGRATWAERIDLETGRPVEAPNIRYENGESVLWPGGIGAHNWHAMSFNPNTGLAYIPLMQIGSRLSRQEVPGMVRVFNITFQPVVQEEHDGQGALVAWDPVRQRARWTVWHDTLWNGGTLTTNGGLVFQGTADGQFSAYNAQNGRRLWQYNARHGINSAPISYSVEGRQYVAVLSGYGGVTGSFGQYMNVGWKYGAARRVLIFGLDGDAQLPETAPPDMVVHALDDPNLRIDPRDVEAGRALFATCGGCHGQNLHAAGSPGPDLMESQIALNADTLYQVVHDGALLDRGMPRLDFYTREQVRQIHAYIRDGARRELAAQQQGQRPN